MTVENSSVIDVISVDKTTGEVVLTISDHLDWSDKDEHILALQNKINKYLAFVESGEILQRYPNAQNRKVVIEVIHKYGLPACGHEFMRHAAEIVEKAGFALRFQLFTGRRDPVM